MLGAGAAAAPAWASLRGGLDPEAVTGTEPTGAIGLVAAAAVGTAVALPPVQIRIESAQVIC